MIGSEYIEGRVSRIEGIIEQMNERIGSIERRLASIETKVDVLFRWQIGITLTMWLTVLIAIFAKKGG